MKKVAKVVAGLALTMSLVGCGSTAEPEKTVAKVPEDNKIQIFKMYDTEEGTYMLDPEAEFENVIFVERPEAEDMGIYGMHHGTEVTGVFDKEGWELSYIKK